MYRVVVTGSVREEGLAILREFATLDILPEPVPAAELLALLPQADAVLHRVGYMAAPEMAAQTKLQLIARHGVGLDYLDLDCIKKYNIPVSIANNANSTSVAEATIGLMLNATRFFEQSNKMLKEEKVWKRERFLGRELRHCTVGLVGYGRIGDLVAGYLDAFKAKVLVYDPYPEAARKALRTVVSFDELLAQSDILSLHCPLTSQTTHMFNKETLAKVKPGAFIVNTARGALFEKEALLAALQSGQLSGVALDSFEHEPPDFNDPIFKCPKALTTSHIASMTLDAQVAMAVAAAKEVRRVLVEKLPPTNNIFA